MERLRSVEAVRAWQAAQGAGSLGFVPTMGALHVGHLTLVQRAWADNACVLASIFVNPLQFGPSEDFTRYPRDEDGDCAMLAAEGVAAVFIPPLEVIYPAGFSTSVDVTGPLTERLEGAARPGHFQGVATVVTKLLLVARADRAYFGMKDAQQLLVIDQMVRDLAIPTRIVPVPTVREPDGVAMSSRNRYLSAEDRTRATAIPRGLDRAEALYNDGVREAAAIRGAAEAALAAEGLVAEYVSCAAFDDLRELDLLEGPALLSLAVRVGAARLIDNRWLGVAPGAAAGLLKAGV